MGMDAPQSPTTRAGAVPHRWTRVEDPGSEAVIDAFETVVAGGLWNTFVDKAQVENAILNLAINARDAMGGHGRLTIEAGNAALDESYTARHDELQPGQYVMVAVSDTGSGMTP